MKRLAGSYLLLIVRAEKVDVVLVLLLSGGSRGRGTTEELSSSSGISGELIGRERKGQW